MAAAAGARGILLTVMSHRSSSPTRVRSFVTCSSRPTKKATSHHIKTRPRKTQGWDIRRKGPTFYPPLPPFPSQWTLDVESPDTPQQQEELEQESDLLPPVNN